MVCLVKGDHQVRECLKSVMGVQIPMSPDVRDDPLVYRSCQCSCIAKRASERRHHRECKDHNLITILIRLEQDKGTLPSGLPPPRLQGQNVKGGQSSFHGTAVKGKCHTLAGGPRLFNDLGVAYGDLTGRMIMKGRIIV